MKFLSVYILLCLFISKTQAQDTLEIAMQHPENHELAIKIIAVNQRYGVANDTGKVLMAPQFEHVSFFVPDTTCSAWKGIIKTQHGGTYALVGKNGIPLTPLDFDEISFFPQTCSATHPAGLVACIKKFGRYGLVNTKGDVLIRPSYDKIELLTDNQKLLTVPEVARVCRKNLYGLMDLRSKQIMKTEYEKIEFLQTFAKQERKKTQQTTILLLRKKGKFGIKNLENHIESPTVYDEINLFDSIAYMARVKKGRKFGFLNLKTELKIPATYDYAEDFRAGVAIVAKRNKYGLIKNTGKDVLPVSYTEIRFVYPEVQKIASQEVILIQKNQKFGVIDINGKTLIPMEYEKLEYSAERRNFEGVKNGKTEFIKI